MGIRAQHLYEVKEIIFTRIQTYHQIMRKHPHNNHIPQFQQKMHGKPRNMF